MGGRFEAGTADLMGLDFPAYEMDLLPSFLRGGPGKGMTRELPALASMN